MSFGGMLLQNMEVSQKEAGHRLFGNASATMEREYKDSIRSVQILLDLILVLVILMAVGVLGYEQWEKRNESKAKLRELGNKTKRFHRRAISATRRSGLKMAGCCGCCGDWVQNRLAAVHAEDRGTEMTEQHRVVSRAAIVATNGVRGDGAGDFESVRERVGRMGSVDFDFEGPINPMVTYATEIEEKVEEKSNNEVELEVRVELGEITGPEVKVNDDEADGAAGAGSGGDEAVAGVSTTAGTQESALRPTNGSGGGESKRDHAAICDLVNPMISGRVKSLGAFAKSRSKRVLRRLSEREGGAGEAAEAAEAKRTIKAVEAMEAVVTVEMEEQEPWLGGSRGSEDVPAEGDERKGEVEVDEIEVLSSPPSPVTARESRLGRLDRLKRLSIEM